MHDEYRKLDLCTGFDSGANCVGCCHTQGACSEVYDLVETPILLEVKPPSYLTKRGGSPVDALYISTPAPPFCSIDSYAVGIRSIDPTFRESLKLFNQMIAKNTALFQEKLNKGMSLEEISKDEKMSFLGQTNGKTGCLLYSFEKSDEKIFFRSPICVEYTCFTAERCQEPDRYSKSIKKAFQEFTKENQGNEKFNTLSYSRMIHLLSSHPHIVILLGCSSGWSEKNPITVKSLNKLLDLVTQ